MVCKGGGIVCKRGTPMAPDVGKGVGNFIAVIVRFFYVRQWPACETVVAIASLAPAQRLGIKRRRPSLSRVR